MTLSVFRQILLSCGKRVSVELQDITLPWHGIFFLHENASLRPQMMRIDRVIEMCEEGSYIFLRKLNTFHVGYICSFDRAVPLKIFGVDDMSLCIFFDIAACDRHCVAQLVN